MLKPILISFLLINSALAQDTSNSNTKTTASQDTAMQMLMAESPHKEYVEASFKAPRVIMSHSIEMVKPGVLSFLILHRFGNVNSGASQFFGLDQATIRLGFDYGITKDLTVGLGRSSYKKEIDDFAKYRIIQQSVGPQSIPFSLIIVVGNTIQTIKPADPSHALDFTYRLGYYSQVIMGRKFNENLSIQIAPTIVHRNLVLTTADPNNTFATGIGGRFKLSHRVSLNIDYYYVFNKDKSIVSYDPLSIGLDIETGGHVFQLHFTNAIGMNERAFITETTNNWSRGDIQFGFNISRAFQVKKKKMNTH